MTLYNDKRPWIEIPGWLDGDVRILLHVRQLALIDQSRVTEALVEACQALDEYIRSL